MRVISLGSVDSSASLNRITAGHKKLKNWADRVQCCKHTRKSRNKWQGADTVRVLCFLCIIMQVWEAVYRMYGQFMRHKQTLCHTDTAEACHWSSDRACALMLHHLLRTRAFAPSLPRHWRRCRKILNQCCTFRNEWRGSQDTIAALLK